ncbi:hypothetical protein CEK28_08435 [Xenophilus sp. AP218F]|nr:hypothetical protein CEK28_08435 [Xenophilus sp. AP218F]
MRQFFTQFKGIAPLVSDLLLAEGKATAASNFAAKGGALVPFRQAADVLATGRAGVRTIYRFGRELPDEDKYWFTFPSDVNVVPGPVADSSERTYFTGLDVPRVTDFALATGNGGAATTLLPVASYPLAVPTPPAPQAVPGIGGTADIETRFYVVTAVTPWGEEGAPSAPSNVVEVKQGQPVTVTLPDVPAAGRPLQARRLYRSATTPSGTRVMLLVEELPISAKSYVDSKPGNRLAEPLPSARHAPPPNDLRGLVALPGGVLAGLSGKEVCFSEPWLPYAWPEQYRLTVNVKPVGLAPIEGGLAVLTQSSPYLISGTEPDSMAMNPTDFAQACVSAASIVHNGAGAVYASPDGLCYLGNGGSRVLTESMLTAEQWAAYHPDTLRGVLFENQYLGFYDKNGERGGFVFDLINGDFVPLDQYFPAAFVDDLRDAVYVAGADGKIQRFNAGPALAARWRSKPIPERTRAPMVAKVLADSYPVTLRLYDGDVLLRTATATSRAGFRVGEPSRLASKLRLEVEARSRVLAVGIADDFRELADL